MEDLHSAAKPIDYRVFVSGGTVLWIELTIYDASIHNSWQAGVSEQYELHPAPFNTDETAFPLVSSCRSPRTCVSPHRIAPAPCRLPAASLHYLPASPPCISSLHRLPARRHLADALPLEEHAA